MNIFDELKRRQVFRVAAAYLVIAWLIVEVVSVLSPMFDVSVSFQRGVVLFLLVAFVPVLVFTWAYEITADGIKKENEIDRDAGLTERAARKLNIITVLAVVAAAGMFAYQQMSPLDAVESSAASIDESKDAIPPAIAASQDSIAASIAVLPFVNMSSDAEQEYFSDGITEEILNALAKIKQLKVAGRTSSFSFKGKDQDLRVIGATLGVAHILEGSVRKAGSQVRITAQLIKVDDGFHMWSETYDGSLENVFDLQENISRQVSDELKLILNIPDDERLASKMTTNIDAYDFFLRGREHVEKRIDDNIPKGIELLEQAVKLDPQFAEAWAVLAEAEAVASGYLNSTAEEAIAADQRAREHVEKAMALNPDLVLPYAVSGLLRVSALDQNYSGAIEDLHKALALEPNNVLTLRWLGSYYQALGFLDTAQPLLERAAELEPLSRTDAFNLFSNRVSAGDFDAASQYSQKVNALYGGINDPIMAYVLSAQGNNAAAIALYMQLHEQDVETLGADKVVTREQAQAFADAAFGGTPAMKKSVQQLGKIAHNAPDGSYWWQTMEHIAIENYDRAFEILESRQDFFWLFSTDAMWFGLPKFKRFRQDPRFAPMLERYGFVRAWDELGWPDLCRRDEGTDGSNGRFSCD